MFQRPAQARIDLPAFAHNLSEVRKRCPHSEVMAVVKANAGGHGIVEVASALAQPSAGAQQFAVTDFFEYQQLREAGIKQPITLLSDNLLHLHGTQLQDNQLWVTIFSPLILELLENNPRIRLNAWLKLDVGMGRLGFVVSQIEQIYSRLRALSSINQLGLLSHLPNADLAADEQTVVQLEQVTHLGQALGFDKTSCLNSAGICHYPQFAVDVVRPGLMLYGVSPITGELGSDLNLQPAMALQSEIISIREMPKGASIGYGSETRLSKNSTVAIVALGYADGYPRAAFPNAQAVVSGQPCRLLGRVSMDMLALDVSGLNAAVGDLVQFWGKDMPVEQVAKAANTIPWELLSALPARVSRCYQ